MLSRDLLITSRGNPRVKFLRSLRRRKNRRQEGRFLIEGIRIVQEALTCGARVETLVYAPDLVVSERARSLIEGTEPSRRMALAGDVFRTLSDRDQPQGIAAVVCAGDWSLEDISPSEELLVVVTYQMRDPGNLGSIIRTADAAGATGVVVVEPSVDPYDPQAVRSTMGSLFSLPVVTLADDASLMPWYNRLREAGHLLLVVASSAHGEQVYSDVDYCRPVILLVGSERRGLPATACASADVTVRLPMAGRATSVNVSAATAALVFEINRQRRQRAC